MKTHGRSIQTNRVFFFITIVAIITWKLLLDLLILHLHLVCISSPLSKSIYLVFTTTVGFGLNLLILYILFFKEHKMYKFHLNLLNHHQNQIYQSYNFQHGVDVIVILLSWYITPHQKPHLVHHLVLLLQPNLKGLYAFLSEYKSI